MCQQFLSHSCTPIEWVCVTNKESHSLFILVSDFYNYLPGPTSLGESNNPSAPQLWGIFHWSIRRVTLYDFTWLIYITNSTDRNIRVWNDSIKSVILPIGKLGYNIQVNTLWCYKYINNILKLETRIVFLVSPTKVKNRSPWRKRSK